MSEKIYEKVSNSFSLLHNWLNNHNWKAYDPFEGLNAWIRPLTFEISFFRQVLVQLVKRTPINLRPIFGIRPTKSAKGLAYIVKGDLLRYKLKGEESIKNKIEQDLMWLSENSSKGYSGHCWGNHFDYQTRGYYLEKHHPTIVWTALVGRAFAAAFDCFKKDFYGEIVDSACSFIVNDIPRFQEMGGNCLSYVPNKKNLVHNANLLGASLLALGYKITGNKKYKTIAEEAIIYSINCQQPDGAWFYGEELKYHWVDNWHTAYNLDAIKIYQEATGDYQFSEKLKLGVNYYVKHFFDSSGIPRYYNNVTYPIDIQCCSQSIDSLIHFSNYVSEPWERIYNVTDWIITNMQDRSGFFYQFRKPWFVCKTPTFHWGQATMYHALSNLLYNLSIRVNK